MAAQRVGQQSENFAGTFGMTHDVYVVEESEYPLAIPEEMADLFESWVLSQREEGRHQGVALLPPLPCWMRNG